MPNDGSAILGAAHTVQRLAGGGSYFLFVEGDSVVSIALYVSLVLLGLCAVVIAIDLAMGINDARSNRESSRRGIIPA
jgi:hypothetical protein